MAHPKRPRLHLQWLIYVVYRARIVVYNVYQYSGVQTSSQYNTSNNCMQDSFARARTRPKGALGLKAKRARDDRVSCIQV